MCGEHKHDAQPQSIAETEHADFRYRNFILARNTTLNTSLEQSLSRLGGLPPIKPRSY